MNGNGARHRKKSLPTPSPNARFRSRARFWSILGSHLGRRTASLGRLSADFRDFFVIFWATCGFSVLQGARGGCRERFRVSGDPPGKDFGRNLDDFLHHSGGSWRPSFVPTSSQVWPNFRSVGVPPSVLPLTRPALQLKGRRSRGAL